MTVRRFDSILVLAAHLDDETLGCGGTIARFADEGARTTVVTFAESSRQWFPDHDLKREEQMQRGARSALGLDTWVSLGYSSCELDVIPMNQLLNSARTHVQQAEPDCIFIPFYGDPHLDHRIVYEAGLVLSRWSEFGKVPALVAMYEVLSETSHGVHPFRPDLFIDVQVRPKLAAMEAFEDKLQGFPHERSLQGIEVLARHRGGNSGCQYAEAFMTVKAVIK